MTTLLRKAFKEAKKLPATEQDALAKVMLGELESERKWDNLFSGSEDILAQLANEALQEDSLGNTKPVSLDDK